jgi:hypothetical protein
MELDHELHYIQTPTYLSASLGNHFLTLELKLLQLTAAQ